MMANTQAELLTSDQTAFGSEEPLFESQPELTDPNAPPPAPKRPWVILIGVGTIVVVLVIVLLMVAMSRQQRNSEQLPTPSPTVSITAPPLQQYLGKLQQDLYQADPLNQEQPFPPVLMDLPVETTRRGP